MTLVDLVYIVLIFVTSGIFVLWTLMLITAAYVVLRPPRKAQVFVHSTNSASKVPAARLL